ncbi:succinylglutamate desuccinylase/aspartoacylase family protein, partial [Litorivivens sp.]|uniref:succinylglutamate desuccinylase/aspartoacylase family protein n=1 Tax=Litorivivens sp. TaxID=2020868 RepID=UPI003566079A
IAAGGNAMPLRSHLESGMRLILDQLAQLTAPVAGQEQLAQLAHSVCFDRPLAEMLGDVFGLMGEYNKVASDQKVFFESIWLRADQSGVLFSEVKVGDSVKKGEILGSVTDPITNRSTVIRAKAKGTIIGMALNQMVMPGFAAYHLGLHKTEGAAVDKAAEGAADAALESVRKVVHEVAKEAAASASESGDDPQAVNEAARKAAEEATKSVITKPLPVRGKGEDTSEMEPPAPGPDDHPE